MIVETSGPVGVRRDEHAVRVRLVTVQREQLVDVGAGERVLREDDDRVGHAPSLVTRQRPSSTPSACRRCSGVSVRAGDEPRRLVEDASGGSADQLRLQVRHTSSTTSASTSGREQATVRPR